MLRRLVIIVVSFAVLPMTILAGYYFYRSDRQALNARKAEIRSEVDLTASALAEFMQERLNDARLWAQISTAKVALDFQRPEGLTQFLNRVTGELGVYDEIVVLDKAFEFFAINENKMRALEFDDLVNAIPKFASFARQLNSQEAMIFLTSDEFPELYTASAILDEYQNVLGYFVAHVEQDRVQRYLDRIQKRIATDDAGSVTARLLDKHVSPSEASGASDYYSYCASVPLNEAPRFLCLSVSTSQLSGSYLKSVMVLLGVFLILILLFGITARWLINASLAPMRKLLGLFGEMAKGVEVEVVPKSNDREVREIEVSAAQIMTRLETYRRASEAAAVEAATVEIARQVAHDIRSPLAALDMALMNPENPSPETLSIVQSATARIRSIAHNLIGRGKIEKIPATIETRKHHLPNILQSLKSEKEMQFQQTPQIRITLSIDPSALRSFVQLNGDDLSRVISNILDNAAEALDGSGSIAIHLSHETDLVKILVRDSGKGIPPEILRRIPEKGLTHGKPNGSGLGLFFAKAKTIEWGGTFEILSRLGEGTTVSLALPSTPPPAWFADQITLSVNSDLIVVDDDASIHTYWDQRFSDKRLSDYGIRILHFTSPDEFRRWCQLRRLAQRDFQVLMDQQFFGVHDRGLKIIEDLKISENSLLCTSASEDLEIQKEALRLKIKILPKSIAFLTEFRILPTNVSAVSL